MPKPEECRTRADECEAIALSTKDDFLKQEMLKLARDYRKLAEAIERNSRASSDFEAKNKNDARRKAGRHRSGQRQS